ncbi:MAG: tetratricopeptide repeat protein, partial [Anaerolineales bacterium]|nr:tetratricopeptide repeat protein [Anaerolineales bacterium]
WSYDLLSQGERQLLSRLAVFNGGCHFDAAEAICAAAEEEELAPLEIDIFDGLASLLDKSLIRQDEQADEPRYTMLSTIHEYATAKLLQSDEAVGLGGRHARYFLNYAAEREAQIKKAGQSTVLQELATEHGNFRAALSWAIDQQQADIALTLAAHLWKFWDIRGHYTEGRQWLTVLLKQFTEKTNPRGRALYGASVLAMRQGDYKTADQYLTESLEIAQQLDDQQLQGLVINMQANLALYKGDFTAAKQLYTETLTLWQQLDLQSEEALALMNLAIAEAQLGNTAEAIKQLEQSLAIRRELKQPREIAETLHNLGEVAMIEQRLTQAKNYLNESLAIRRELKDQWGISYSLHNLGQIAYQEQRFAEAVRLLSESLQIKEGLGEQWGIAYVRYDLGEVAHLQGNNREALHHHQAALQSRAETGDKPGVWQSLIKIAQLTVTVAPPLAVFLWVAIAQHINAEKQLPPDTLSTLKKRMSAEEFSQASKKGENSSQAEIIQLVLAYTY